jgi:uncharacterized protein (DUF736 family)
MAKKVNRPATRANKRPAPRANNRPAPTTQPPAYAQDEQNFDNELRGVLFPNARKTRSQQPDLQGSCEIDGVEYWISAWTKVSRQGQKYLSLAFTPKFDEGNSQEYAQESTQQHDEPDDLLF